MFGDTSENVDEVNCPRFLFVCIEITIITKNNMIMRKLKYWSMMFMVLLIPFMASCGDDEEDKNNTDIAITGSCIEVGENYARIEGYFNQKNVTASYSSLKIGVECADNESFKSSKFVQSNVLEGNKFEVKITGLKQSTVYYYRTCVKVDAFNYVGKTSKFTTIEGNKEFPDYQGGTKAYFAYQNPVRTLVLGNDIYDNSLDNDHKCRIWATMGGAYGGRDATVDIVVDNSLCDNLYFLDKNGYASEPVLPMPKTYYSLLSNKIPYNGDSRGYVEVQFTDAFFNDPKSIENTYVIPILMTNVTGIDDILTGTPREGLTPARTNTEDWEILPKDYVLYCVKYMNPWQAKYIRRGVDMVTENGGELTKVVRKDFSLYYSNIEYYSQMDPSNPVNQYDEVCSITTKNMTQAIFPVTFRTSGASVHCNLILTFNGSTCTISTDDSNVTATGSGEFIVKGTEREEYKDYRWGSMNGEPVQRDILRLAYNVNFTNKNIQVSTTDTMVVQTRESNKKEFFDYKYIKK